MIKLNSNAKIASLILVLSLGLFYWANSESLRQSGGKRSLFRFPASQIFGQERSANVATEKRYAADLAIVKKRGLASIGHPASPLENFRFGVLEGKYQLTMDGDKVAAVSFIDNPDTTGSPTLVNDRMKFLTMNAGVLGVAGSPQRVAVDLQGTHVVETYKIKQASGAEAKIKITLDESDRLLGLQSEKGSNLKIF